MRRSKAIMTIMLTGVVWICSSLDIQAMHQHSENCYVLQEHVHTGSETSGGGCYGVANYHVHSGDSTSGGGCYGAVSRHVHTGDATSGGGCYGAANYHVHSGDSVNGGGCYTMPAECGGNISATKIAITCNRTKGGYIGKTSWPCGCGDFEYQESWYIVHTSGCEDISYPTYYIRYCSCGINYNEDYKLGTHTGHKTVYSCEVCGETYAGPGVCTKITSYTVSCGKTEQTAESYSLSCGKNADTVEGYSLNCGKTTETAESYSLNCDYQDDTNIRVLICNIVGNEYADLRESGIGKIYKRIFCENRIFTTGRCKQIKYWQFLCFKEM